MIQHKMSNTTNEQQVIAKHRKERCLFDEIIIVEFVRLSQHNTTQQNTAEQRIRRQMNRLI
jgi:hypothetical protein